VGDLLIIIMESTDSTTTAGTPTTPNDSGGNAFSKIHEQTYAAGSSTEPAVSTLTIFAKIAVTGGLGNVTVSGVGNHCAGAMVVVAGHGLGSVSGIVVGSPTNHGTTTANNLAASINVRADSFIILAIGLGDDANDTTNVSGVVNANLASITERVDRTVSTGSGGGIAIYTATCAGTSTGTTEWDHDTAAQSQSLHLGVPPIVAVDPASPGSFTETGAVATVVAGRLLSGGAIVGSFSLTGVSATFVIAAAGIELAADPGSLIESGIAASLPVGRVLADGAGTGSFGETGVQASMLAGRVLASGAVAAAYVESGAEATLAADRINEAGVGAFALGGVDTTLLLERGLTATSGAYAVDGTAALLDYVSAAPPYHLPPVMLARRRERWPRHQWWPRRRR